MASSQKFGKDGMPVAIGGWLILPAIGLALSPILGVVGLLKTADSLKKLSSIGAESYGMMHILLDGGLLVLTCLAAFKFFKRERDAPKFVIALLVASFLASIVLFFIGLSVFPGSGSHLNILLLKENNFIAKGLSAFIWILYFKLSERVKETFIN